MEKRRRKIENLSSATDTVDEIVINNVTSFTESSSKGSDKDSYIFSAEDKEGDIVLANEDIPLEIIDGAEVQYGYRLNPDSNLFQQHMFLQAFKRKMGVLDDDTLDTFFIQGMGKLEERRKLSDYHVLVVPDCEENSVLGRFVAHLKDTTDCSLMIEFKLMKRLISEVEFDSEKAKTALCHQGEINEIAGRVIRYAENMLNEFKSESRPFTISYFIPKIIRLGFKNFLRFRNPDDEKQYQALQGVRVLLVDDTLASSATIRECIRILKQVNENNEIDVFILLKCD